MRKEELLENYDYLNRLAGSKCDSQADADDLVSETMLAAFAYLKRGGVIEHPKTWLANTLMHKFNSALRKKYRRPTVTYGDGMTDLSDGGDLEEEYLRSEEATELRRELLRLAKIHREVLIRYYFNGESVSQIAQALGIPEGTVKRRLYDGRVQMKKGLEDMSNNENRLPGRLEVGFAGSDGKDGRPLSLVDNLIAQNILMIAYEKPLKVSEISRQIGIPAPYIEPIIEKLTDGELMVKTGDEKYYTDFIIHDQELSAEMTAKQVEFVKEHFDVLWESMSSVIEATRKLDIVKEFNPRQLKKLERWMVMRLLQDFRFKCQNSDFYKPDRRDGGRWCAMGWGIPGDYKPSETAIKMDSYYFSGCRTSSNHSEDGKTLLAMSEFDTGLWDHPSRWGMIERNGGYESLRKLLWALYKGTPVEESGVSTATLESVEKLINNIGVLARENGKLIADIPIISEETYNMLEDILRPETDKLYSKLGSQVKKFIADNLEPIPAHLKSVPDYMRHPTDAVTMGAVREAYDRGLHLSDVDYCCPPMIMVFYE